MKFFVSAGEASGDIHAAQLIRRLKGHDPKAEFRFLGGDLMCGETGCEPLVHYREMAYMGFSEVLRHLPSLLSILKRAKGELASWCPDALILVDYPSFNLKLAKEAHRLGIPVYYYISPKVWAWKEYRVRQMRRYVDKVLSILPFEVDFFRRHGLEVAYVGNPSREEVDERLASLENRDDFFLRHGLDSSRPLLALVPGSRLGEIRNNLPVMDVVASRHPEMQPVIAGAPGIETEVYRQYSSIPIIKGETFSLMAHASVALVTSGTATLEAALIGVPQVALYRANGSRFSYELFKRILKVSYVTLPNLIAGREIIREMLLHRCTPDLVDAELTRILPGGQGRDAMFAGYADMRRRLGDSPAADEAAKVIVEDIAGRLAV